MSMSVGMVYAKWKEIAEQRGWHVPPAGSVVAQWQEAWINYWLALEERERKLAAGEPDPGRPVAPHRSGGARPVSRRTA